MPTGLERRTLLSWMVEPDERAPVRSTAAGAESFSATGAGSTTTTVSTVLTEAANSGYVGQILKCIAATNAANVGIDVLITGFVAGVPGTLTHTDFPAATSSGDQFVMYLPPDPICVETTGGATDVIASARNEPDVTPRGGAAVDYYRAGDNLVARRATNVTQGQVRALTAFNAATGAFTQTDFGANTAIGDLYYLRRFPKLWGPPNVKWEREDLEHVAQRGDFSLTQKVAGAKSWTAEVTLPLKGSGTAAGAGVLGVAPPELERPLLAILDDAVSTGSAVVAQAGGSPANSPTVFNIATGTLANFPIGTFIMDDKGRASVVTASAANGLDPDSITHAPGFAVTPATGTVIYGGRSYQPKLTGHLTMTLDCFVGGVTNVLLYGGLPTFKLVDFKRNSIPKIVFNYRGNFWVEAAYATPAGLVASFDTLRPESASDVNLFLGTTRLIVEELTFDPGIEIAEEDAVTLPDAIYGGRIVGFKPTFTVKAKLDTAAPNNQWAELQRYWGGQTFSLFVQHGKARGRTVCVYGHRCNWVGPQPAVADNLRKISFTAEVLSSELTDMPDWLFGVV